LRYEAYARLRDTYLDGADRSRRDGTVALADEVVGGNGLDRVVVQRDARALGALVDTVDTEVLERRMGVGTDSGEYEGSEY
jgi:hypothetical protein